MFAYQSDVKRCQIRLSGVMLICVSVTSVLGLWKTAFNDLFSPMRLRTMNTDVEIFGDNLPLSRHKPKVFVDVRGAVEHAWLYRCITWTPFYLYLALS